jgi:threonine/homoserine/homoserine lactone efflux protein
MATSGATAGIRASLPKLLAELAGYLIAIATIRFVLGPIIHAYPLVGAGLKIAVAIYLVWIAVRLWQRPLAATTDPRTVTFASVFITTLLNPKALIFALTIIPQDTPLIGWYVATFSATVIAAGFGWILIGTVLRATAGQRSGVLPKIAALALIGFAGYIASSAL